MKIKWMFLFPDDHVTVDLKEPEEDTRIATALNFPDELLFVPSAGRDVYINLRSLKCIVREEINEETPTAQQPEEN